MKFGIYCDESSTTQRRYMVIGGLWVPSSSIVALRTLLATVRQQWRLGAEMKWTKVSPAKLDAYRAFVEPVFELPGVSFRCIVVDTTILDYGQFHHHDPELGFYKFAQLVVSRNLAAANRYALIFDQRTDRKSYRLAALRETTNNWCALKMRCRPVLSVEARDSKQEDLLQLADILLGAVAAAWNGSAEATAKLTLLSEIAQRANLRTLAAPSPSNWRRMNIWRWQPRARGAKEKMRPGS